jgi:hypothetical protein
LAISTRSLARADVVDHQRLGDDVVDRHARVERAHRILEHELDAPAELLQRVALQLQRLGELVAFVEQDASGVGRERAHDDLGQGGLAAAGFADQPQALAALHLEADIVDRQHLLLFAAEEAAFADRELLLIFSTSSSGVPRPAPSGQGFFSANILPSVSRSRGSASAVRPGSMPKRGTARSSACR